jgi:hypothetical protein
MTKKFPCPYCQGQGEWVEVVIEETGQGPLYTCGVCEGQGMIEIDGPIHQKMKNGWSCNGER